MNTKSKLALIATAALASTTVLALPSQASLWEQPVTRTETVKYKVSDAATPEGAAALYAKLQESALRVCSTDYPEFAGDTAGLEACVADALSTAVQRVAIPTVSVLHLQAGKPARVAAR